MADEMTQIPETADAPAANPPPAMAEDSILAAADTTTDATATPEAVAYEDFKLPEGATGVLLLLLGGAGLVLKWSYEDNGTLKAGLADRDALLRQKAEDATLSAGIIDKQQKALAALDRSVFAAIQKVNHEPVSTTCAGSLPMRDATRSLHELFAGDSQPPAGRQPAAAMR